MEKRKSKGDFKMKVGTEHVSAVKPSEIKRRYRLVKKMKTPRIKARGFFTVA